MPEDETKKSALCPICDSPVDSDAKKCPECKADLTVFGVKTGDEDIQDVDIPEYEESLEKLLGKIGEKDEKKEHELFEEIMAAVDKTGSSPEGEVQETTGSEAVEEGGEAPATGTVMFECPLCNTLVSEDAKSCTGCGAIFAGEEEGEAASEAQEEAGVEQAEGVDDRAAPTPEGEVAYAQETTPVEETPSMGSQAGVGQEAYVEEAPTKATVEPARPSVIEEREEEAPALKEKKRFKLGIKRKKERIMEREEAQPAQAALEKPTAAPARDDRSLHRELTTCVSEVKPLLATARQFEINVFEGRKLIDQAITAGKKRDFKRAITLVKESKKTIEKVINQHVLDSVQTTQVKINALNKAGGDVRQLEDMVVKVESLVKEGSFVEAVQLARSAAEETEKSVTKLKSAIKKKEQTEKGKDVAEKLKALIELIKSGEQVRVNVKGAKALLTQARVAIKKNELNRAEELLSDAKEDFLRELPKQLADIISNSKPVLYKAKMQGVDIRPSIKLLKEASTALKLNNYLDALDAIKQYQSEMAQYM
ncbi:MAG: hypothetical protein JSW00_02970 [Thermoplasmata archaeon]|nr:MAG: hypothetical protein JSW00_02970 [Thermoplasmata archaeon]